MEYAMGALEAIKNRRSVRSYKKTPVAREKIEALVEAANSAPFAGAFHITVLLDKNLLDRLDEATFQAMREADVKFLRDRAALPGYRPLYGAPALLVFSAPEDNPFGMANCANAATTGAIAATAMGLGSCFEVSPLAGFARDKSLEEAIALPEGHKINCCLIFGHTEDPEKFRLAPAVKNNVSYKE